ncbi:MAG: hypothetical protein JNG88_17435 [Phycisphaerales bacterium]|nr:hypothetical protein [Phycisphaerales bacterium]
MPKRRYKSRAEANRGAGTRSAQRALIEEFEARCVFGPVFFLTQLRGFVRDRCPDAAEMMPVVELHLHSGESLDICHVIGVAARCVALAVYEEDESNGSRAMRTELVPYESIIRVTIRTVRPTTPHMGFNRAHAPTVLQEERRMTPEAALRAAAMEPPATGKPPSIGNLDAGGRNAALRVRRAIERKRHA